MGRQFVRRINYPVIEIATPSVPYEDFNARTQYDRWQRIPSDVIPTSSLPIIQTPSKKARWWQGQEDGSANVHVVNSSGAGAAATGFAAPYTLDPPVTLNAPLHTGLAIIQPFNTVANRVFGVYAAFVLTDPGATVGLGYFHVELSHSNGNSPYVTVALVNVNAQETVHDVHVVNNLFPVAIDTQATWSTDTTGLGVTVTTNITGYFGLHFYCGNG